MDRELHSPLNFNVPEPGKRSDRPYLDGLERWFDTAFSDINNTLNRKTVWFVAIGALLAIQFVLVFKHEPWLDEYQALQVALQSPDLASLFENLHYEGHPPLWYLLLIGTASLVSPIWVLATLQALIIVSLQLTILIRAPFARLEKLLIGSSAFVLFEYGTISRSLGLGALLLALTFAFRHRRMCWLFIALLPMADFLFGVLSLACIAILTWERRLWPPGIGLWLISSLTAAWTVLPADDMFPAMSLHNPFLDLGVYVSYLSALLVPLYVGEGLQWNMPLPIIIAPSIGILFIVFSVNTFRGNVLHQALVTYFLIITACFSAWVYPLQIRHLSLIAYLLILLKWRDLEYARPLQRHFRVWLLIISACGLLTAGTNLIRPFDTAAQAAQFIRAEKLENKHWFSFPEYHTQGISALLGMEFQGLERNCTQTFVRWNIQTRIKTLNNLNASINNNVRKYGNIYLITNFPLHKRKINYKIILMKYIKPGYDGHRFFIYSIGRQIRLKENINSAKCLKNNIPLSLW